MIIKICGLSDTESAAFAAEKGADLLGFVFAESTRRITPEQARRIIKKLPSSADKVGVFVNEEYSKINEIADFCGLDIVQLHGSETPEECRKISVPVIKGIRIKDENSLREMSRFRDCVEMFVLDTYVPGAVGGTGKVFDWNMALHGAKYGRILLAGGLNSENVYDAIRAANPFGVDVSSGVESLGKKDLNKIDAFIANVRGQKDG
ncbi:phosphoribosylanthranilate isomerase [Phosphitispora sp. TUW77]|uniref:phosphoribosylanthranilate isomerase n=1 Tax=Phosphitispora sp. TUW77 TaxID=3152361 RepID=UPI003AB82802